MLKTHNVLIRANMVVRTYFKSCRKLVGLISEVLPIVTGPIGQQHTLHKIHCTPPHTWIPSRDPKSYNCLHPGIRTRPSYTNPELYLVQLKIFRWICCTNYHRWGVDTHLCTICEWCHFCNHKHNHYEDPKLHAVAEKKSSRFICVLFRKKHLQNTLNARETLTSIC